MENKANELSKLKALLKQAEEEAEESNYLMKQLEATQEENNQVITEQAIHVDQWQEKCATLQAQLDKLSLVLEEERNDARQAVIEAEYGEQLSNELKSQVESLQTTLQDERQERKEEYASLTAHLQRLNSENERAEARHRQDAKDLARVSELCDKTMRGLERSKEKERELLKRLEATEKEFKHRIEEAGTTLFQVQVCSALLCESFNFRYYLSVSSFFVSVGVSG